MTGGKTIGTRAGQIAFFSVGSALAFLIGGMVAQLMGLPAPQLAQKVNPEQLMLGQLVTGVLVALIIGPIAKRLRIPLVQRAVVLFVLLFGINSFVNVLEALFFTTTPWPEQFFGLTASAVSYMLVAVLMALVFRPEAPDQSFGQLLYGTLQERSSLSWVSRIALASVLYVPTYFVFGVMIYPLVRQYYEDPALGLGLAVPGIEVILPLEIFRGLLFVLALFPVVLIWKDSFQSLAARIALTLCVLGAWHPMLMTTWFPLKMRIVHGAELTVDAIVHGVLIAWCLFVRQGKGVAASQGKTVHR